MKEIYTKGYRKAYMAVLEQIKKLCLRHYRDRLISLIVFGSVAKGSFSPVSDIDLLIVLRNKRSQYREYSDYYKNVESRLSPRRDFPIEINPIFKSSRELSVRIPYLWNTEFLIMFDRDNFFRNFLIKLGEFKRSSLIIHREPLEYVEIMNGQQRTI